MPVKVTNKHSDSYAKIGKKVDENLVRTIINSIDNLRDKLIFEIFLNTGINPSELVELKYQDFDFKNSLLIIRKEISNNKRQIKIPEKLLESLKNFANPKKSYIFSSKLSPQLTLRSIHRIIKDHSQKFDVDLTTQDLKELFIKSCIKNKGIEKVKEYTGLKSIRKREIIKVEKIEKIKKNIKDIRDYLIFELLISGLKPKKISDLKPSDIPYLEITQSLVEKLNKFVEQENIPRHQEIFLTRQKTKISNERILQIIKKYGKAASVKANPRLLNNTAISLAISSNENLSKLNQLKLKKRLHLYRGFIENE